MKKIITILAFMLIFAGISMADSEKAVPFDKLPEKARTFIMQNFPDGKISYSKQERDFLEVKYEVVFVKEGVKIEFDRRGEWTEIECRYSTLDERLIPEPIRDFVNEAYAGAKYRKISRDKKEYEVKLTYGLELTFDRYFNLMDIDD